MRDKWENRGLAPALVSLYAPSPLMATGAGHSAAGETLWSKGRPLLQLNHLGAGQGGRSGQQIRAGRQTRTGRQAEGDSRVVSAGWLVHGRKVHAAGVEEAKADKQRDKAVARYE
ncbi:hypothetical protein KBAD11_29490 [Aeromonas dhakensis]|nr:hypothetical protein KBAD45_28850 [Aeromonas dhakensis]CAD7510555.1 hypothetical protein KBAD50_13660 [Aeromonas dhakensis]CAD7510866.1 hypothetical protein KBAD49_13670 [Aeromonas dhakensis]CAD7519578.1 hypothetical protein KBAD59_29540 [Aeromonas dhakensis]CAD7520445.1 hypothetical protein KBAD11_29490 [Aeromonas dhakensis]